MAWALDSGVVCGQCRLLGDFRRRGVDECRIAFLEKMVKNIVWHWRVVRETWLCQRVRLIILINVLKDPRASSVETCFPATSMSGLGEIAHGGYLLPNIRWQGSTLSKAASDERVLIESYNIEHAIAEYDLSNVLLYVPSALSNSCQ